MEKKFDHHRIYINDHHYCEVNDNAHRDYWWSYCRLNIRRKERTTFMRIKETSRFQDIFIST